MPGKKKWVQHWAMSEWPWMAAIILHLFCLVTNETSEKCSVQFEFPVCYSGGCGYTLSFIGHLYTP